MAATCLSVPARVTEVNDDRAVVMTRGETREVDARFVRVRPGDFVLVQGAVAIAVISARDAAEMDDAWAEVVATHA